MTRNIDGGLPQRILNKARIARKNSASKDGAMDAMCNSQENLCDSALPAVGAIVQP